MAIQWGRVSKEQQAGQPIIYTHPNSYYPVPVSHIPFEKFPLMARDEPVEITAGRYAEIKNWAAELESGRLVRQRSVRQDTTKYNAGTLPLNAYRTPLLPGDLINLDIRLMKHKTLRMLTVKRNLISQFSWPSKTGKGKSKDRSEETSKEMANWHHF